MRFVLLALLATACDQGAAAGPEHIAPPLVTPAPAASAYRRFEVHDDADFVGKATAALDELATIFSDGSKDCERVAVRIEDFAGRNTTRFAELSRYGKEHPKAEEALREQFKSRMDKLIEVMMPTLTACSQNERLLKAFQKFAETQQQFQQRPR